jgi:hypothetical protein
VLYSIFFFESRGPKKRLIAQWAMTMLLLLAVIAVSLASLLPWFDRDANQSGWQASFARGVLPFVRTSIVKSTGFSCGRPVALVENCTGAIRNCILSSLLEARLMARSTLSQLASTHATAGSNQFGRPWGQAGGGKR